MYSKHKQMEQTFKVENLKPYKFKGDTQWTITADLRGLETFENCESNYDVVERLKAYKVLTPSIEEDSEFSQFFANFKTKAQAESFLKRLGKYVELRKKLI